MLINLEKGLSVQNKERSGGTHEVHLNGGERGVDIMENTMLFGCPLIFWKELLIDATQGLYVRNLHAAYIRKF